MSQRSPQIVNPALLLTVLAMLAFAANSLLCRFALGQGLIDAATFTTLRITSGAVMLGLIMRLRSPAHGRKSGDWRSAAALFIYMVFFSFGYLSLSAGTGALILFGAVQLTMFAVALRQGEYFSAMSWIGLALAILGLIYLVSPGVTAPDLLGAVLMAISGIAWGLYSLLGRKVSNPLEVAAGNFVLMVPVALVVNLVFWNDFSITPAGLALAIISGAIASAGGYIVWYAVLPELTAVRAATVQLTVPAIAALGGAAVLAEPLTLRLVLASAATLGGVIIVLLQRASRS